MLLSTFALSQDMEIRIGDIAKKHGPLVQKIDTSLATLDFITLNQGLPIDLLKSVLAALVGVSSIV